MAIVKWDPFGELEDVHTRGAHVPAYDARFATRFGEQLCAAERLRGARLDETDRRRPPLYPQRETARGGLRARGENQDVDILGRIARPDRDLGRRLVRRVACARAEGGTSRRRRVTRLTEDPDLGLHAPARPHLYELG